MILGMGAAGIVIETRIEAEKRGVLPIAQLLGSTFANSAYHAVRACHKPLFLFYQRN